MATTALDEKPISAAHLAYTPSWLDRLQDWVDTLPLRYWITYALPGFILLALVTLVHWQVGAYPYWTLNLFHIWLAFEASLILAWMHYLDRFAAQALEASHPTLTMSDAEYRDANYRITHLPARPLLIASLAGGVMAIVFVAVEALLMGDLVAQVMQSVMHPLTLGVLAIVLAVTWAVYGAWFVHTYHQLRLVNRIYAKHTRINLYDLGPVFAFSGLAARSAMLFVLVPTLWFITDPIQVTDAGWSPYGITITIVLVCIGLGVFLFPLWGIHVRLGKEKGQLLGKVGRRIEHAAAALHSDTEKEAWDNVTKIKDALLGLETEQRIIEKMPTWPWAVGTFRILLTAILLPVILFVIQFIVGRFLSP